MSERGPFNSFTIVPRGLRPEPWRLGEWGEAGAYRIVVGLENNSDNVGSILLTGPLTLKNEPGNVKNNLEGYGFGKSIYSWDWQHNQTTDRYYHVVTILYGEADDDPAKVYHYNFIIFEYTTTTRIAKDLINAFERHTLIRAATEVTTAPRRAEGPANEQGRRPRDPTFQRLPDVARTIRSFLGRGKKHKKSRRRKTLSKRR